MNIDFNRERAWWDAKAQKEDISVRDDWINKALRWRVIEAHLPDVTTILEIGGGTGAFSIPLAQRGFSVTHLDLSPEMIRVARERASNNENIKFVEGNVTDLSAFPDRAFDLVLNMDGAISFCGPRYRDAIKETCRVANQKVIITVSHRALMSALWVDGSIESSGKILDAVHAMFQTGRWDQAQFPDNPLLSRGCTQDYFGSFKAFLPEELESLVKAEGLEVVQCRGIGTLAFFCSEESLQAVRQDKSLKHDFIDLCDEYDTQILPRGFGTRNRAGLMVVAIRDPEKQMSSPVNERFK